MPPSEPPRSSRSRRRRTPTPQPRRPPAPVRVVVAQARAQRPAAPSRAQRARAQRSLGFAARNAPGTFQAPRGRIVERKRRAQRAQPARPMPHVPIIRNPTPRQAAAARTVIAQAVNRHAGGDPARRREVLREIQTDPRHAQTRRAIAHYTQATERQTAQAAARAFGVRGTRSQQIRAGRVLVAQTRARNPQARAGRAPAVTTMGFGPATVRLPTGAAVTAATRAIAAATSLDTGDIGPRHFARNVGRDIGALATGPFVGGYELGAGAVEAVQGRPQRLERLGKGVAQSTYETVRHPIRSFEEHPLLTPLTFAAGVGTAGRVSGALARGAGSTVEAAGVRGALARAGSTVRPPVALSEDAASAGLRERKYSKDLVRKALQVASDRDREPLRHPDGSVVTVTRQGREVPVLKPQARVGRKHERDVQAQRQADFTAARANSVERQVREEASKEMRVRGVRGRRAKDLVSMVVEGTITSAKNFEGDLRAHRARLAAEIERGGYYKPELKAAQDRLKLVDEVLANPRAMRQSEQIVKAGEDIGRRLNAREAEAIRLGLLDPRRAERARLVPAAIEHMGARHFTPEQLRHAGVKLSQADEDALVHGAIRHPDGRFLSNAQVRQQLQAKGRDPATVAFLTHRLDTRGARAFHTQFRPGSRPRLESGETRTGAAYRRGSTEASTHLIREQGVRQQTQIAKAKQLDRMVGEHGIRHPAFAKAQRGEGLSKRERQISRRGGYFNAREAQEYATRIRDETGEELVPVRAYAAKLSADTKKLIRDDYQGPAGMETLHQRLLAERLVGLDDASRERNVVLMPKAMVDRLAEHVKPSSSIQRMFQYINRPFRMAVLPQFRWLAGNFVEPYLVRLTGKGSGINVFGLANDWEAARRTLRQMERSDDPKVAAAAKELQAQQFGGLFVGGRGATIRRTAEDLPGPLKYGAIVRDLPVLKQMVDMAKALPNAFFAVNRVIEGGAQRAAFGRAVREDIQEFTGSWTKTVTLGQKAVEQAARGLTNTSTQRRFMDAQHELLGKYEGYSPQMRALTQTFMPFLPWALNAARFVFWTMPAHRTVQTAVLQKTNDVVQKDWEEIHKDVPPGSLKYAVPNGKGGWIDLARYTPWGLTVETAGGGGFRTATSQILPQIGGTLAALEGRDPFGQPLRMEPTPSNPRGTPSPGQMVSVGINTAAESAVPYLGMARRLREGGGTAYSSSNILDPDVKPGTTGQMSAANRVLNPIRPVYLRNPGGSGGATAPADDRAVRRAARAAQRGGSTDAAVERALKRARRAAAGGG